MQEVILHQKEKRIGGKVNKNQKIIFHGFIKSIGHRLRKNEMFIIFSGIPKFYVTGAINKKVYLIIEEEKEEKE